MEHLLFRELYSSSNFQHRRAPRSFEQMKLLRRCTRDQPWQTAGLCAARACVCAPTACLRTSQAPFSGKCSSQGSANGHEREQNSYPKIATLAWVLVWAKGSQKHSRFRESSLLPPQLLKFTLEKSPYQKRAVIRYTSLPKKHQHNRTTFVFQTPPLAS